MQLKGLVKFFTAALIIFSLYRLSFTLIAHNVDAEITAKVTRNVDAAHPELKNGSQELRTVMIDSAFQHYTDSVRNENVYSFLGSKYTYQELKTKELQLGLDLQGGMSVTLEVGQDALIKSMSNSPEDPLLKKALEIANSQRGGSDLDYPTLFGKAYASLNPSGSLARLFTKPSETRIKSTSSNEQVLSVIKAEEKDAIQRTYEILQTRIDKFGVTQPNISLDAQKGTITVELAGMRNPELARKYLQATAKLQFWEVMGNKEFINYLANANNALKASLAGSQKDTARADDSSSAATTAKTATGSKDTGSLSSILNSSDKNSNGTAAKEDNSKLDKARSDNPLFSILQPLVDPQSGQPVDYSCVGVVMKKDTAKLMEYLNNPVVRNQFPSNIKFLFGDNPLVRAEDKDKASAPLALYAIETQLGSDHAKLEGDMVKSARFDYANGKPEIQLAMNAQGTTVWSNLTRDNVGKFIAISLDDYVYTAPRVNEQISGGTSSITGSFDDKEGTQLANILQTGKLPVPATIVQEQIVGPTLGAESVNGGMKAFFISFAVIFALMLLYYNNGGWVANVALILNLLFTFGVLANMGATLTMAGIAGIILGIGMAVDSNVIIFERIKEELALGDTYPEAIKKGYARSYAPVLDGHITNIITAVILLLFGMGPIKGFATTQVIALILSLFTGILVSRLITEMYMHKGRHFNYFTKISKAIFQKSHFKFIEFRKYTYIISTIFILLGVASFFHGFDYGVEFDGGRSYTINFDRKLSTSEVRDELKNTLGKYPVVKTVGDRNQLNITTDYLIDKTGKEADAQVVNQIYTGLKAGHFIPATVDMATFTGKYVQSNQTVSPTISKDLRKGAVKGTIIAIVVIFIYIFIRFRKWQYSMGTIVSLVHDSAIILAVFSFAKDWVPFALEIDQHFIAALLTVIGFSMNDTVIVFDRIREYFRKTPNANKHEVIDHAINDTMSRTIMTSLTVFLTAVILFIFGGEALRGFAFAMSIGVLVGTYSSIFVASPILVDMDKKDTLKIEEDKEERIKRIKAQA